MAAADAHGVCTGTHAFIAVGECATYTTYDAIKVGVVHIGVGLCVVVLLVWAMRGPQCVEQQRAGFPRFFRMCPELCRLKINRCLRGRHGHEAAG